MKLGMLRTDENAGADPERVLRPRPKDARTPPVQPHGKNVRKARELVAGGGDADVGVGVGVGVGDDDDEPGVTSMSTQRFSPPSLVSHALG